MVDIVVPMVTFAKEKGYEEGAKSEATPFRDMPLC
jgi:hypothetical protein